MTGRTQRIFVVIGPVAQKITLSQMHLRADICRIDITGTPVPAAFSQCCAGCWSCRSGFDAAVFRALKKPFVVWHWLLAMFVLIA